MSETPETIKAKDDPVTKVTLSIRRQVDASTLLIDIRAPLVADIIAKMAVTNFERAKYAEIYQPILKDILRDGKPVGFVETRGAISKVTSHFVGGTDFNFSDPPRACLLANPEKLREGYTLTFKVEQPVPPDLIKKWGKAFMDGCHEIISNARPFKMNWVLEQE